MNRPHDLFFSRLDQTHPDGLAALLRATPDWRTRRDALGRSVWLRLASQNTLEAFAKAVTAVRIGLPNGEGARDDQGRTLWAYVLSHNAWPNALRDAWEQATERPPTLNSRGEGLMMQWYGEAPWYGTIRSSVAVWGPHLGRALFTPQLYQENARRPSLGGAENDTRWVWNSGDFDSNLRWPRGNRDLLLSARDWWAAETPEALDRAAHAAVTRWTAPSGGDEAAMACRAFSAWNVSAPGGLWSGLLALLPLWCDERDVSEDEGAAIAALPFDILERFHAAFTRPDHRHAAFWQRHVWTPALEARLRNSTIEPDASLGQARPRL